VTAIANRDGKVVGAVYYTNYRGHSIEMGWAGEKGWLTRDNLAQMFGYPFLQLGVQRVWGLVHRHNKESRRLAEKLGCRFVGTADGEYGPGQDAIIYSMTKGACRWIKEPTNV
jgi:RimJ/RimL family protein N-acetyltransferase